MDFRHHQPPLALILVALSAALVGCDTALQAPTPQALVQPVAPTTRQPVTVGYRRSTVPTTAADHDLADPPTAPTKRDWTDRTGKFHTSAVLLDVAHGVARLQRPDKIVTVPVAKLSDADYAYLATSGVKAEPRELTGRVIGVHDGDTLTVLDEHNRQHKIRLASIDAPELKQAFGSRAQQALSKKVFQKDVRITWNEHDKYGRTIGNIYVDRRWINKEMVEEGWAWHYRKYSDSAELAAAEATAQRSASGLWTDGKAEPPWEYRHNEKTVATVPKLKPKPAPKPATKPTPAPIASSSSDKDDGGDVSHVKGYFRKDGKYVEGYDRSKPNKK